MNSKIAQEFLQTDEQFLLDLKTFVSVAIAQKSHLHGLIDTLYDEKAITYLTYYKESRLHNNPYFKTHLLDIETYATKVGGIIEYTLHTKDTTPYISLYKQAFKKIYGKIKSYTSINVGRDIISICNTQNYEGIQELTSALFTCIVVNKPIQLDTVAMSVIQFVQKTLYEYKLVALYRETNYHDKIKLDGFKDEIDMVKREYGLTRKNYTFDELVTTIIKRDLKDATIFDAGILTELSVQKKGKRAKYIGALEGTFKYFGISLTDFSTSCIFTPADIDDLILNYVYAKKFNHFDTKQDLYQYFVQLIYIWVIVHQYKDIKEKYLQNVNEDFLIERDSFKTKIQELNSIIQKQQEQVVRMEQNFKQQNQEIADDNTRLEREIQRLQAQLVEYDELKKEVVELRESMFIETTQGIEIESENPQIDMEFLNSKKVAVLGGHTNWQRKMKEVLPEYRYVNSENKNADLSFLNNMELIVINTQMKHSFYYRILKQTKHTNIPIIYLNLDSTNGVIDTGVSIEKALWRIQEKFKTL